MKRLVSILFILVCATASYSQVANCLPLALASNPIDSAVVAVVSVDTIPGLMNRMMVVTTRSLRFNTKQIRGLKDSVGLFTVGLYRPITYVPTWTSITSKPSFAAVAFSGLYSDLTGTPSIPASQVNSDWNSASGVSQILNKPIIPTNNNQLTNGAGYLASFTETDPQFDTKFAGKNTGGLAEGSNLYYTATQFNTAFSGKSTTDLSEGTNLYWTSTRFNTSFSGKNTDALTEGVTNLYYSNTRARTSISLTTTGTGAATYNNTTGALNIPTPPTAKRIVTYSGTSDANGVYTATFSPAFSVAPNIQANITNQSATNQFLRVTSVTATGFTVNVFQRSAVTLLAIEVLLASVTNVSGAAVDVLVVEK